MMTLAPRLRKSLDAPATRAIGTRFLKFASPRPRCVCLDVHQAIVKLGEGFNGADMRNICTEAGLFAIRAERDYVVQEDFMKVRRGTARPRVGRWWHGAARRPQVLRARRLPACVSPELACC
jgi:hypothetical protein